MRRLNYSYLSVIYTLMVLSDKRVETKGAQTHKVEIEDGLDASISNFNEPRALSYHHNDNAVTWLEAFRGCGSSDGKIASPFNPPSHESLRTYMISTGIDDVNIWLGARVLQADTNNTRRVWFWETYNQSVLWTNFHLEPSTCSNVEEGHCLSAYRDSATAEFAWCGRPCEENLTFICEFGTPPQATTTTTIESTTTTTIESTTTTTIESTTTTTIESTTSGAGDQTITCAKIFWTLIFSVILFAMKRMY